MIWRGTGVAEAHGDGGVGDHLLDGVHGLVEARMPDLHATPVLEVQFDERRDLGLACAFGVRGQRSGPVVDVVEIVVGQDVGVLQI